MVTFDRPELSPCLQKMDKTTPAYEEALGIVKTGQEELNKMPRADMPGFAPAAYALPRLTFYDERQQQELAVRKAIDEGRKIYDEGIRPPR